MHWLNVLLLKKPIWFLAGGGPKPGPLDMISQLFLDMFGEKHTIFTGITEAKRFTDREAPAWRFGSFSEYAVKQAVSFAKIIRKTIIMKPTAIFQDKRRDYFWFLYNAYFVISFLFFQW